MERPDAARHPGIATLWHRLGLYLSTLRHLRPIQIYRRAWFRLYRPRPKADNLPVLALPRGPWIEPARREPSLPGPGLVRLLGETHPIDARSHWNDPARARLWLYHLHYFDDLNARDWVARVPWQRGLIERWVTENPPGAGPGWEPYPSSLRIVNWLKWALAGNALAAPWSASLALQARWLAGRLEWHLLGNHLLANAKALIFAGLCYRGREADGWLGTGLNLLGPELSEQVMTDGGHCERSPMYHSLILEDLLDLRNLVGALGPGSGAGRPLPPPLHRALTDAAAQWAGIATRMDGWLKSLCHPDGEIALLNDAALGIAPPPGALHAYGRRLGLAAGDPPRRPLDRRTATGYLRLGLGPALVLLDVGEIGPDYQPGHAHADTLSFELSLWGQRAIVDSGTSCYGSGPERLRQRGTAAHNTVTIDGADSSEVWDGFRVARRAHPQGLLISERTGEVRVACSHDGYRRLPGRPRHRREWCLRAESLTIADRIEGTFRSAVARLHLHPDAMAELAPDGRGGHLMLADRGCTWAVRGAARTRIVRSSYHPHFGVVLPCLCLEMELEGAELKTTLIWDESDTLTASPARTRCISSS